MTEDARYMEMALDLAARSRLTAFPNPAVGAVVVGNGEVVGEGYHEHRGGAHAEVVALEQAGRRAEGGTLYINLEPCAHHGRTPPCTDRIIKAGIIRVVAAIRDPHPVVDGSGLEALKKAGIEVAAGEGRARAERLNDRHLKRLKEGRPAVGVKVARTLDGRIAAPGNRTMEITGPAAREWVGRRRSEFDAIMVGSGTVLADDPVLTARDCHQELLPEQPVRVVADARLQIPVDARLLREQGGPVYVLTGEERAGTSKAGDLRRAGARLLPVGAQADGGLDPRAMLSALAEQGIDSILMEGGAELVSAFAARDLVDIWHIWIGPMVAGAGPGMLARAVDPPGRLDPMRTVAMDGDILITALPSDSL